MRPQSTRKRIQAFERFYVRRQNSDYAIFDGKEAIAVIGSLNIARAVVDILRETHPRRRQTFADVTAIISSAFEDLLVLRGHDPQQEA